MLFYIHVCFKDLGNVYGWTYVSHFVNILPCVLSFLGYNFLLLEPQPFVESLADIAN